MSTDPIILTRVSLVEMRWESQGQIRGGTLNPPCELYQAWHEKGLIAFGSDLESVILIAERYAAKIGTVVEDFILETQDADFQQEPAQHVDRTPLLSTLRAMRAVPSVAARLREPLVRAAEAARQLVRPHPHQPSEPGPLLRLFQRNAGD